MNKEPLTLDPDIPYDDVIKLFREHHRVNPIPVIDKDRKVLGVISRFDVLRPFHVLQGVLKYF
ncbi:MAG: CBS domain-containing protein [Candidatus Taylorbacteria bacterium]|nr:CBS domain-containing protein [Candidatus Taylorbacteria bacterium]